MSPVPTGWKLVLPIFPPADESQDEEISSSTKDKGESIDVQELTEEDLQSAVYLAVFKSACPEHLTKVEKCSGTDCLHELPDSIFLENFLKGNTMDLESTYMLVKKFKPELRNEYLPMLAKLFAIKGMTENLKIMLEDISKIAPFIGFSIINDALLHSGWSPCDAVKFIVDNHEETEQNQKNVRTDIVALIGSLKRDVLKFMKYLKMVEDDSKTTEM